MPERRDRSVDVLMRDGLLRKGKPVGHADARGRIREADSPLRTGAELGYVDEKQRVRRRSGFLRRGEVVGRLRGNAAYVGESLLAVGTKVGFVDETGQVWQADCAAFRARSVGRARGADPESALAYFMLKFCEIDDALRVLEQKVGESDDRYPFLPRIRAMQRVLPEVDAIGDFDGMVARLDALEEICAADLGQHFQHSRDVLDETVRSRPTPESIVDALRQELNLVRVPEQADALVGRVREAIGVLTDTRRPRDPDQASRRSSPPPAPSAPAVGPGTGNGASAAHAAHAAPVEREERATRVDQLLEVTFGSVDRVREELERIRRDPDYSPEDLVDSMRSAMTSMRVAGERFVNDAPLRRREERTSTRPPSSAPANGTAVVSTSTALVRVDPDDASTSRQFAETIMKTQEAEQVFEILDLGIERLKELDVVRREGVSRLRKAFDALRRVRR